MVSRFSEPASRAAAQSAPGLAVPRQWLVASTELVSRLTQPELPELLVRAAGLLVEFEYGVVFVYRGKARPVCIYDSIPVPLSRAGLGNYTQSTYVLNPFYAAYCAGLKSGVYRMRELAPDGFFEPAGIMTSQAQPTSAEELGYLTDGWPAGREELCIALVLPDGECAEISLSQESARGGFPPDALERLAPVVPFLEAVFRQHWRIARQVHTTRTPDTATDDVFQAFGGKVLSPRERQLAQLLLRGHSTVSVALQLAISPTTVKTHRKNLYAKLGIATQYELFSKFLEALKYRRHD